MGWFSDLRDKILYPTVGFALGGPTGAAVTSAIVNADEISNPPVKPPVENTVSRTAVVDTKKLSGKQDANNNSKMGISPEILLAGGFTIIVLIILTRG